MPAFLKSAYDTEGPLGLPMKDKQAKLLESILDNLPQEDRAIQRLVAARRPTELLDGERADVSWISTEEIDRDREIVAARGMNDSHFKLNPIVTLQHCYQQPPVGRSLWRKRVKDGSLAGIKAKTQYPARPDSWPEEAWTPDTIFALIQAGMMQGKSIGFLRLKSHAPSSHEIAAKPALADCARIIDEWLLLEYACVFLPANQSALVEAVSKGSLNIPQQLLDQLGIKAVPQPATPSAAAIISMPFTSEEQISQHIRRRLTGIDPQTLVEDAFERARGRI